MRLRVVDETRWRRVKITICIVSWLIGIACIGGLEAEGTEPFPSIEGALVALAVCAAMLTNLSRTDPRRRHGR